METILKIIDFIGGPIVRWGIKKLKKPDPVTLLKRRERLKSEFIEKMEGKSRFDVIIRNIDKLDNYPENDYNKKTGVSTYFKAEYKDIYHRGIQVFINGWKTIKEVKDGKWEFCDYKDEDALSVIPLARIPFDLIDHVVWEGDEYYNFPIIFCRFKGVDGGPYEEIPFCTQEGSGDNIYYQEVEGFRPWDKK